MDKSTHYVIYDLLSPEFALNPEASPAHIVYPKQLNAAIHSKHFRVDGERVKTIYFKKYDQQTKKHTEPAIREEYVYNRDSKTGLIERIDLTISWMLKSGKWSTDTKLVTKYFTDSQKQLDELRLRRCNLISEISGDAADFGLAEAIGQLYDKYFLEIGKYRESGSKVFYDVIVGDSELAFLNYPTSVPGVTIRTWLLSKFIIGVS